MAAQAKRIIEDAVMRKDAGLGDKLLDKAFALAFRGLVYAQIWEDPVVDMEGLDIHPEARVMCIASVCGESFSHGLGPACRRHMRHCPEAENPPTRKGGVAGRAG